MLRVCSVRGCEERGRGRAARGEGAVVAGEAVEPEGRTEFPSKAKSKKHTGLKGGSVTFHWEEQRQQSYSSSVLIPLPNVEDPLPLRVLADHAAELVPGPAATRVQPSI